MNALLIDAGNTRLKWAHLRGGRLGTLHSLDWGEGTLAQAVARAVAHAGHPDRVLVASVAGARVASALRRGLRAAGLPAPEFVTSQRSQAGVASAYHWPEQLGVDRWLGLLAAHALYPTEAVCIVSVGTALTVDLLDSRGRHHGGVITPGPALMVEALLESTAEIRRRAERAAPGAAAARAGVRGGVSKASARQFFARDTRTAIHAGGLHAAGALTEYAMSWAREVVGRPPRLLLSGGGARDLQRLLAGRELGLTARRIDNLVLRGLAVVAQPEAGQ
jgi:type III pantothenate kinase